jgi:hypothetical protein
VTETTSQTSLNDERARLEREAQAATGAESIALLRQKSPDANEAAEREVLAELHALRDQISFKQPGVPAEGQEREAAMAAITERIIAAVQERGFVFAPTFGQIRGLMLADPSIDREAREATQRAAAARVALREFTVANADAMADEDRLTSEVEFKRAIRDGDVEASAGILRLTMEAQKRREDAAAMTLSDLPN